MINWSEKEKALLQTDKKQKAIELITKRIELKSERPEEERHMLTEEAYRERKWGNFPVLRRAIEAKRIPGSYYGLTSVDDNIFDQMARLLEITILTLEHEIAVKETALSVSPEKMCLDLNLLRHHLEGASSFLKGKAQEISELWLKLKAPYQQSSGG